MIILQETFCNFNIDMKLYLNKKYKIISNKILNIYLITMMGNKFQNERSKLFDQSYRRSIKAYQNIT